MSEKFKGTGAGKGDKSRVSDYEKYSRNMERVFEKKNWRYWCIFEGYDPDTSVFDGEGLEEGQQISYSEYRSRVIKLNRLQ
jgi:hypothetical protein